MKKINLITLPLLSIMLFGCSKSPVNEHPTKTSHSEEPSEEPSEESIEDITEKEFRVLFIGNSFTYYNDLDQMTENLGKSLGLNITCDKVATGSYHLYQYADENNSYGQQVTEKLSNNQYSHVIIQEHSTSPVGDYNSFLSGATSLKAKIKQYQPNAEIRLYETWGFTSMATNYKKTIIECEEMLCEAYQKCGKELKLGVHYVGRAFSKAYTEQPSINLYYTDDKHPSFAGTYLSGLVHLASITGVDIREVTYVGVEGTQNAWGETYITNENATLLKNIAYSVYTQYGTSYNA